MFFFLHGDRTTHKIRWQSVLWEKCNCSIPAYQSWVAGQWFRHAAILASPQSLMSEQAFLISNQRHSTYCEWGVMVGELWPTSVPIGFLHNGEPELLHKRVWGSTGTRDRRWKLARTVTSIYKIWSYNMFIAGWSCTLLICIVPIK